MRIYAHTHSDEPFIVCWKKTNIRPTVVTITCAVKHIYRFEIKIWNELIKWSSILNWAPTIHFRININWEKNHSEDARYFCFSCKRLLWWHKTKKNTWASPKHCPAERTLVERMKHAWVDTSAYLWDETRLLKHNKGFSKHPDIFPHCFLNIIFGRLKPLEGSIDERVK